jgi:hypothetical protein
MNKTLSALINKLSWQLEAINQLFEVHIRDLAMVEEKRKLLQGQIQKASKIARLIHPEQEISRLNFIVHCQQEHENLDLKKKEFEYRLSQLQTQKMRFYTEIKLLENYQIKKKKVGPLVQSLN